MDFYSLQSVIICHCHCLILVIELSQIWPLQLDHPLRTSCVPSSPQTSQSLESAISPRAQYLSSENFRSQVQGARCARCYWGVAALRPSQRAELAVCSRNHDCPLTPPALGILSDPTGLILAGSFPSFNSSYDQPTCACPTPISATTLSPWLHSVPSLHSRPVPEWTLPSTGSALTLHWAIPPHPLGL